MHTVSSLKSHTIDYYSMIRIPSIIATLATAKAIKDLRIFLESLAIFNTKPPTVYIYCDSTVAKTKFSYPGKLVFNPVLDTYTEFNRQEMERIPGKHFKSLWFDFMTEKINLIRWVFSIEPLTKENGVLFCDADICFMRSLPIIPMNALLALSPHGIREEDTAKYGLYNGGYVWMLDSSFADKWWEACSSARFYEQSALEDVAMSVKIGELYEFPPTENYGWWRLWQGIDTPETLKKAWSIFRSPENAGILIDGEVLGSVHTHFHEKNDSATQKFNEFVKSFLIKLEKLHIPAKRLLAALK